MAPHIRTLGLLAALVTATLGLATPARGEVGVDQVGSGFRLMADARWDRTLAVRYHAVETDAAPAEPVTPTFRSGSDEAAEPQATALPPLALDTLDRPPAPSAIIEAEAPLTSRPGPAGSWLEVVAPEERDLGLFLTAQSALLVDMAQTLEINGSVALEESNRLLGEQPSDGAVLAYFGSIAAVHVATYLALDPRWANIVSRAILFVQVPAIDNNARLGVRIAF